MRKILIIALLLFSNSVRAQLNDDFSDGNFLLNPVWTAGNSGTDFIVLNNKLRSNSSVSSGSFYISTPNMLALNCKWEFWINLQFNTSGTNYADIYLISDKADLKSSLINGYFIRIGNTDDEICLYKRSGLNSSSIKLIDGINGITNSSNNTFKLRVTRNNDGLFSLERELTGNNASFFTEGTFRDISFTNSSFFGVFIQQSTSNFYQKHFFDDFSIEPILSDTNPPELTGVSVIDSTILEVTFNEAMDSIGVKNPANFSLTNFKGQINNVQTSSDPAKFKIKLNSELNTGKYDLTALNVKDKNGNLIQNKNQASFNYIKPYKPKFRDIIINEIFADPVPQIDLPSVEYIEILNSSNETLSLNNWKLSDLSSSGSLGNISIAPNSYLILCAKADTAEFKKFGNVLGISSWPSLNNSGDVISIKDPLNNLVDSISYSDNWHRESLKKQGGWSLERVSPSSICEGIFNWLSSNDPSGGTPGKQNSVFVSNYDKLSLKADSLNRLSDSTLLVYFNKPLNSNTLIKDNFIVSPSSGQIKEIKSNGDFKQISLTFSEKFKAGTSYQLSISGIKDCSGNTFSSSSPFRFSIPALPAPPPPPPPPPLKVDTARVFITEIFADPSPEVGLPLVEFIELFNPGTDTLDLEGWSINDPQTKGILKKHLLPHNQYLIICPAADTLQYKSFGRTLGISPWPSLNNSSDQIVLKSFKNRLVDSLSYSDTWYGDPIKKLGGWSMERIHHLSPCTGPFIWTASKDLSGGTPGKQNSVFVSNYDKLSLKADSLNRLSDSTLLVYFNKPLNNSTLTKDNFSLAPSSGQIKEIKSNGDFKQISLTFSEKFKAGTSYQLSISGIKDCSGNTLSSSSPFRFSIPALPAPPPPPAPLPIPPPPPLRVDTARIFITEIFADPSPEVGLPLVEFIELLNPGTDTLDLEGWSINDPQTKGILKKHLLPPNQYLIICPAADTLQYKSFGRTLGISPWPSLNNSSDQIVLKSFKNRLVDSVYYSEKWHKDPKKQLGGWTLEKINLTMNACNGFYNWGSSTDETGGTPGRKNRLDYAGFSELELKIDSIHIFSESSIDVHFNQIPDTSYFKASNFSIRNGAEKALKISIDASYKRIRLTFIQKFSEGEKNILRADSLFSCSGKSMNGADINSAFGIAMIPELEYPILINEIFADPSPVIGLPEAEFIELFNPTENTVKLKGLSYGKNYTFQSGEMDSGSYLIICSEKDTLEFKPYGKVIGIPAFSSLNNQSDTIKLRNNKGRTIQQINYIPAWFRDAEKRKGGYSLELIDPKSICSDFQNWNSSSDTSGGTPGRRNSVYQQNSSTDALKLIEIEFPDSISIVLSFNRSIDSVKASIPINFHLNNGVGNPEYALPQAPNFNKVILKYKEPLTRGRTYRITASNIGDCSNTSITTAFNSAEFQLTPKIEKNDVILSEILFNPRSGGSDFVEIYNNTSHSIDLKDLSIARIHLDTVNSIRQISRKQFILESGNYLALSSNPENINLEYLVKKQSTLYKISSLPVFNDDSGIAVLISSGKLIDQLSYNEKMHFPLIKNTKGVSLERSKLNKPASEAGNLRSATSASGGATPGYQNSQKSDELETNEDFSILTKTFSPDNDGFEDVFEMKYKLAAAGEIANVSIYNDQGVLIKKLLNNFTLNTEGTFIWDGLNEQNQLASVGIYLVNAELFNLTGRIKKYRKSFALVSKLN